MERITFNRTLSSAVLHAWATEFNRAHREAPICASMWRLRFAALFTFGALVFLAGRALAETNADAPTGKADVVIDLATRDGVDLVKGQWRYSDTKIIEVGFKAVGPDKQPTGKPNRTYDFTPHAGVSDFDDSKWEKIDPTTLDARRSTGRLCFNWYRINITIPAHASDVDLAGATVVFETSIDDYAEIWVDGELSRAPGQSGGSVVKGWNAANRLIINRSVQPGQKIQLAIFGANGPLSNPPTNYIYMREAKLEFYKGGVVPVAITPSEVNVEIIRKDPALDAIVPPNPKIFKLAEGFKFTEGPVWDRKGGFLLFSDPRKELPFSGVFAAKDGKITLVSKDLTGPNGLAFSPDEKFFYVDNWDDHRKIIMRYEVNADGTLKNGKVFFDMTSAGTEDALDGMKIDKAGNLYVSGPGGLWIRSPEGKHHGTIIPPKHPHNFAWGDNDGKTLYICARSGLYRMRLNIEGIRP